MVEKLNSNDNKIYRSVKIRLVKKDLKLSDRLYRCDCCGNVIDRDVNASINLANYNIESIK